MPSLNQRHLWICHAWLIGFSLLFYLFGIWAYWWSALPHGSHRPLGLLFIGFLFLFLVLLPAAIILMILQAWKQRVWPRCAVGFLLLPVYLAIAFGVFTLPRNLGWKLRKHGLEQFTVRMQPLIDAINQYEQREGHPPDNLNELKARGFIQVAFEVNGGREGTYRNLSNSPHDSSSDHAQQRWMLSVPTAWGLGFDYMFYYPDQNYPESNSSGAIERIGNWAYVHE